MDTLAGSWQTPDFFPVAPEESVGAGGVLRIPKDRDLIRCILRPILPNSLMPKMLKAYADFVG